MFINGLKMKNKYNLTFKLTENENNGLAADIDKIVKKEQLEKLKSLEMLKNKEDRGF